MYTRMYGKMNRGSFLTHPVEKADNALLLSKNRVVLIAADLQQYTRLSDMKLTI